MSKLKKIVILLIICLTSGLKSQTPFVLVREAINTSNYYEAEIFLDSCKQANYFLDSVIYYKALLNLRKSDVKLSRSLCTELQRTYPQFTEAIYLSGLIFFVEEKYGKSIAEFNKVLKENPKHLKATYNRALAKGLLEDYFSAIKDLGMCIALAPNFSMAYYSRAYWYEYTGKNKEAVTDYEQCIVLDPKNYDAYFGLAYVYKNLKENEKACETITMAIKAGSPNAEEVKENFCK